MRARCHLNSLLVVVEVVAVDTDDVVDVEVVVCVVVVVVVLIVVVARIRSQAIEFSCPIETTKSNGRFRCSAVQHSLVGRATTATIGTITTARQRRIKNTLRTILQVGVQIPSVLFLDIFMMTVGFSGMVSFLLFHRPSRCGTAKIRVVRSVQWTFFLLETFKFISLFSTHCLYTHGSS